MASCFLRSTRHPPFNSVSYHPLSRLACLTDPNQESAAKYSHKQRVSLHLYHATTSQKPLIVRLSSFLGSQPAAVPPLRCRDTLVCTQRKASRAFSVTTTSNRDHHFDTLKFVQRLKDEGFTEEQSVAMMKVLSDVIEER